MLVETHKKKNKTWKEWKEEFMMGARAPPKLDFQPANDGVAFVDQGYRLVAGTLSVQIQGSEYLDGKISQRHRGCRV